jgi:LmbE family N-acetylglucosaminyl deacetylase
MKILAIGAHPDDIELGCGGLLIKAANQGHQVYMYTVTRGSASGDPKKRTYELTQSAQFIGAKALWIDNFEDTKLSPNHELIHNIEFFINKADADLIITHSLNDTHHDHRAVASSTIEAGRFNPNILSYEIPLTKEFKPQVYYDISEVVDKKVKLIKIFWSQHQKLYLKANAIKGLAEYRALQSRLNTSINFVEAYEVIKLCFGQEFTLWKVPSELIPKNQAVNAEPDEILEFI